MARALRSGRRGRRFKSCHPDSLSLFFQESCGKKVLEGVRGRFLGMNREEPRASLHANQSPGADLGLFVFHGIALLAGLLHRGRKSGCLVQHRFGASIKIIRFVDSDDFREIPFASAMVPETASQRTRVHSCRFSPTAFRSPRLERRQADRNPPFQTGLISNCVLQQLTRLHFLRPDMR